MNDNKKTTVSQMKRLALRVHEKTRRHGVTVTLPAAGWNEGVQTVSHEYLLADSRYWYFVASNVDCLTVYGDTGVRADDVTVNGEITFRCEVTPDVDLTANILRLEVEK